MGMLSTSILQMAILILTRTVSSLCQRGARTMSKASHLVRALALPTVLALALSACALGRSVINVTPPVGAATDGKAFAKIMEVRDIRTFEARPSDAGTPSLQNASEINDKSITSRAVARKRGGFGLALGDVVLPEGQTVSGLVRGAAQKALQEKGYTVVDETSPRYTTALPLSIDIAEFWSWFSPGAFSVRIDFKATLNMTGDSIVGPSDPPVTSHVSYETVAVFESTWTDLIQRGISDLSEKMKERIKSPSGVES